MIQTGTVLSVGVLLAVVGALGLALQSLAIRYGTVTSDSEHALIVVLLVNLAILTPVTFILEQPIQELTLQSVVAFSAAGLLGSMLGRALHFESIKRIGSSRTEPIKSSQPLHASLVAVVVLGETVGFVHLLSMVCIVAGIALISYGYGQSNDGDGNAGYVVLVLPLLAALFYGIEPTLAKIGFADGASTFTGILLKVTSATIGATAYVWWKHDLPRLGDFDGRELPWLVGAGVCNTLFLFGYYGALGYEPVSVVVPLVQSSPLFVIALSALFVTDELEQITWRIVVAGAVVVVGAVGVTLFG